MVVLEGFNYMKKVFSIIGLIIGYLVVTIAFAYFATMLIFITFPLGFLIDVLLVPGFIIGMVYISKLCINKFQINVKKFIIYSELPSTILSLLSFFVVNYLIDHNYFGDGMLAGFAEYILSIIWLICSASILVVTIIVHK